MSTIISITRSVCVLLLWPSILHALSLPTCLEPRQRPEGYTYTVDPVTGQTVWSFCQFPDPRHDHQYCGLPDWSEPSFLCDPERLIGSHEKAKAINTNLLAIQGNTSRQCNGPSGKRQGFIVSIILVDRIRVGSPYSADSCVNECGEIYPTVNTTARAPTDVELDIAMETFADRLRLGLRLGACGNDIVLLYSQTHNRIQISMGSKVADVLTSSDISDLRADLLDHIKDGKLDEGLLSVSQQLRSQLRGLTPADIMLIITVVSAVLLFLIMVIVLQASDVDYNVWGHEGSVSKVADVAVKAVTGVYVIDWVFQATAHVSGRLPLWPVVLLFVSGVACLLTFYVSNNLYTRV